MKKPPTPTISHPSICTHVRSAPCSSLCRYPVPDQRPFWPRRSSQASAAPPPQRDALARSLRVQFGAGRRPVCASTERHRTRSTMIGVQTLKPTGVSSPNSSELAQIIQFGASTCRNTPWRNCCCYGTSKPQAYMPQYWCKETSVLSADAPTCQTLKTVLKSILLPFFHLPPLPSLPACPQLASFPRVRQRSLQVLLGQKLLRAERQQRARQVRLLSPVVADRLAETAD